MRMSALREALGNTIAFVLVIAACGAYLAIDVYHAQPWSSPQTLTLRVQDSYLVLDGTPVYLDGVKSGRVADSRTVTGGAELVLEYPAGQSIPADSVVEIELQSALGEPYVNVIREATHGPALPDGAALDTDQVAEPESIPGVFENISALSEMAAADPLAGVFHTVRQALDGNATEFREISDGTRLIASMLMSRRAKIATMFTATQNYGAHLEQLVRPLPQFTAGMSTVLESFLATLVAGESLIVDGRLWPNVTEAIHPFLSTLNPYLAQILPKIPPPGIDAGLFDQLPTINVSTLLDHALAMFGEDSLRVYLEPK